MHTTDIALEKIRVASEFSIVMCTTNIALERIRVASEFSRHDNKHL